MNSKKRGLRIFIFLGVCGLLAIPVSSRGGSGGGIGTGTGLDSQPQCVAKLGFEVAAEPHTTELKYEEVEHLRRAKDPLRRLEHVIVSPNGKVVVLVSMKYILRKEGNLKGWEYEIKVTNRTSTVYRTKFSGSNPMDTRPLIEWNPTGDALVIHAGNHERDTSADWVVLKFDSSGNLVRQARFARKSEYLPVNPVPSFSPDGKYFAASQSLIDLERLTMTEVRPSRLFVFSPDSSILVSGLANGGADILVKDPKTGEFKSEVVRLGGTLVAARFFQTISKYQVVQDVALITENPLGVTATANLTGKEIGIAKKVESKSHNRNSYSPGDNFDLAISSDGSKILINRHLNDNEPTEIERLFDFRELTFSSRLIEALPQISAIVLKKPTEKQALGPMKLTLYHNLNDPGIHRLSDRFVTASGAIEQGDEIRGRFVIDLKEGQIVNFLPEHIFGIPRGIYGRPNTREVLLDDRALVTVSSTNSRDTHGQMLGLQIDDPFGRITHFGPVSRFSRQDGQDESMAYMFSQAGQLHLMTQTKLPISGRGYLQVYTSEPKAVVTMIDLKQMSASLQTTAVVDCAGPACLGLDGKGRREGLDGAYIFTADPSVSKGVRYLGVNIKNPADWVWIEYPSP